MTEYINIQPHPALNLAFHIVEALKREGFTFEDEDGNCIEGLALVAAAGVLMMAERQDVVTFQPE